MPIWRCPHCGTPQAETSRCWVCRRSTTSCATCRHFRRGVASGLGLCGLDPRRLALRGNEMHACWTAPDAQGEAARRHAIVAAAPAATGAGIAPAEVHRTFVPVDEPKAARTPAAARPPASPGPAPTGPGWSLWGDAEA